MIYLIPDSRIEYVGGVRWWFALIGDTDACYALQYDARDRTFRAERLVDPRTYQPKDLADVVRLTRFGIPPHPAKNGKLRR